MRIVVTSVYVDDEDKALRFYTNVLGFAKKTEIPMGDCRWLTGWGRPRRRRYWETHDDVVKGAQWGANSEPPAWCGSDKLDPQRKDYKVVPELYNLDCAAYESILLGLFTIWRG